MSKFTLNSSQLLPRLQALNPVLLPPLEDFDLDVCFNSGGGVSLAPNELIEEIEELSKPANLYDSHPLIQYFPQQIKEMIAEVAEKALLIPDYVATSMLTNWGSAIGNSLITQINNYYYKPILYSIIIGDSSVSKSPVQDVFTLVPNKQKNKELAVEYEQELAENNSLPKEEQKEVLRKRVLLNKGTIEGVYKALKNNEKGILLYRDELSGWLANMNKYGNGKGDEVQCYLELWKGNQFDNALSSKETSLIDKPFLCILGNITPNSIQDFAKNGNDKNGFLFRFLLCFPDKPKHPQELINAQIDEQYFMLYSLIYNKLYNLGAETKLIKVNSEAYEVFRLFFNDFKKKSHFSKSENEQSIIGKMIDYVPRFALILQALEYALGTSNLQEINKLNMNRAVGIAKYFYSMAMKIQRLISEENKQDKNSFTEAQIEFYENLPQTYKGSDMMAVATKLGITKSKAYNWQNQFKQFGLIKELDFNLYQKNIVE